jgi:hypothetical protein
MNNNQKIILTLLFALLLFAGRSEQLRAWFWQQSVFWQVMMAMGSASIVVFIVLRAFGAFGI